MLELYLIFILATAIFAYLELFRPVLSSLELYSPNSIAVTNKKAAIVLWLGLTCILAPIILVIALSTKYSELFRNTLQESLE